ncbi:hypothetical protein RCH22_002194 [Cryobacterium psychrotolerans]|nr:hypothetical protein [Cryobacterium psychrotolerans]
MREADEMRQAYERLIAAVGANDPVALAEILSPGIVDHSALPGQPPGLAGITLLMRGMTPASRVSPERSRTPW